MNHLACALLIAFTFQVGCGDDGSTSDKFPDEFETNVTLDDIGQSGLNKICNTFEDWVRDMYSSSLFVQAACTASAIESTETASDCGDELQSCLDNPPSEVESLITTIRDQAGCGSLSVEATGCSATVGQIQDCLDALGDELDNIQFTLTCAAAGQTLDDGWWVIETPAACSSIETSC